MPRHWTAFRRGDDSDIRQELGQFICSKEIQASMDDSREQKKNDENDIHKKDSVKEIFNRNIMSKQPKRIRDELKMALGRKVRSLISQLETSSSILTSPIEIATSITPTSPTNLHITMNHLYSARTS